MKITLALRQQIYLHKASPAWNEKLQHMSMTAQYTGKKKHLTELSHKTPLHYN